jgi:hypothetical protein
MAVLLDHLERGNNAMQPLLLSLIADLLQHSRLAHDCLHDWLSADGELAAPALLLRLWREVEADWGVCEGGVLASVHRPLAGSGKRALWIPKREARCRARHACASVCSMLHTIRPLRSSMQRCKILDVSG